MTKNSAQDFNEWMASIGNIYYSDKESMSRAFEIIYNHKKR